MVHKARSSRLGSQSRQTRLEEFPGLSLMHESLGHSDSRCLVGVRGRVRSGISGLVRARGAKDLQQPDRPVCIDGTTALS